MTADGVMPITRQQRAVLRFPDPKTSWAVVAAASLIQPVVDLGGRLAAVCRSVPIVGARLGIEGWVPHEPPLVMRSPEPGLGSAEVWSPFDLEHEPPLRVRLADDDRLLVLTGHHAALDGLSLVRLISALLGGEVPHAATTGAPARMAAPWGAVRRLLAPADRIAPSRAVPPVESFAVRTLRLSGPRPTARLAAACAAAAGDFTRARGAPWRRIGISIGVGGPPGVGNVASYRRVDIGAREDVEAAVLHALESDAEPVELAFAPRAIGLLEPIAHRFSDSFLISNVGRHKIAGVSSLAFFPVARGRSAVAFGAAGVAGGSSTLSIRAPHLSLGDCEALLDAAVTRLAGAGAAAS
jgi:hypothetical protein